MDILDNKLRDNTLLLKQHKKAMNTARVIVFLLLAFLLITYTAAFIKATANGISLPMLKVCSQYGVISAILLLNIFSYRKPFISLLLLSLIILFGVLSFAISSIMLTLYANENTNPLPFILGTAVQAGIAFFIVKGAVAARKYELLKKKL